jgi:hypothetical protein
MAFATETFGDVNSFTGSFSELVLRLRPNRGLLSSVAVIGGGTVVFAWVVATLITTQTMVMSVAPGTARLSVSTVLPKARSLVGSRDRVGRHVSITNPPAPLTGLALPSQQIADMQAGITHTIARSARLPLRADLAQALAARMAGDVAPPAQLTAHTEMPRPAAVASLQHPISRPAASTSGLAVAYAAPDEGTRVAPPVASFPRGSLIGAPVDRPSSLALADAAHPATGAFVLPVTPAQSLQHPLSVPSLQPSEPAPADGQPTSDESSPVALPPSTIVSAEEEATVATLSDGTAPPIESIPLPTEPPLDRSSNLAAADAEPSTDDALPDSIPLPAARPRLTPDTARVEPSAPAAPAAPAAVTRQDDRPRGGGLLARLFGGTGEGSPVPGARGGTAIYDIQARTVYLPGGERLEAHSGLGAMRDNPRYVHAKNTGPTPPSTYALTLRESLFHGVEAIRLTPVSGGNPYGRVGLLAHTYMLGQGGNSNGCVVFRDYRRFLGAFKRGEIKRLVVVTSMSAAPFRVASR